MNQPIAPVSLESIRAPIAADLKAVDEVIRRRLDSEVVLVRTIADYIIAAGAALGLGVFHFPGLSN